MPVVAVHLVENSLNTSGQQKIRNLFQQNLYRIFLILATLDEENALNLGPLKYKLKYPLIETRFCVPFIIVSSKVSWLR